MTSPAAPQTATAEVKEKQITWNIENELEFIINKKFEQDKNLALLESKIHKLETSYFQKHEDYGSIVFGYSKLFKYPEDPEEARDKEKILINIPNDAETKLAADFVLPEDKRVFSRTSVLYKSAVEAAEAINSALDTAISSKQTSRTGSPMYFGKPLISPKPEKKATPQSKKRKKFRRK